MLDWCIYISILSNRLKKAHHDFHHLHHIRITAWSYPHDQYYEESVGMNFFYWGTSENTDKKKRRWRDAKTEWEKAAVVVIRRVSWFKASLIPVSRGSVVSFSQTHKIKMLMSRRSLLKSSDFLYESKKTTSAWPVLHAGSDVILWYDGASTPEQVNQIE